MKPARQSKHERDYKMYTYKVKTPIALILFKRKDTALRILDQVRKVQPERIYLLSDQGRTEEEILRVRQTRAAIENAIDWPCEIIKFYAESNLGVYRNIGLGAKRVFEKEDRAIFLEDDNYPEITFFQYADEMLERYADDERILWVCGTNYLTEYCNAREDSYFFTQHLLPCGWASWKRKFLKYYDGELENLFAYKEPFFKSYQSKALAEQQWSSILGEYNRKQKGKNYISWDYQMLFSIRANDLLGIAPCVNQIRNIGADSDATHGGTSLNKVMTRRFCEVPTKPLEFPLHHPVNIEQDELFNKKIGRVILLPLPLRIKNKGFSLVKKALGISGDQHLKEELKKRLLRR